MPDRFEDVLGADTSGNRLSVLYVAPEVSAFAVWAWKTLEMEMSLPVSLQYYRGWEVVLHGDGSILSSDRCLLSDGILYRR